VSTQDSGAASPRRAARRGDDEAGVVAMLQELAPQLDVDPDPAFRAATRQRLVAMAAVRTPEPARPSPLRRLLAVRAPDTAPTRWRTRATAGLAGAALTVTSLATLVALSTGARPGDVLYGLKRGTEQTQIAMAGDSRGQVLLDLARTRLDELRALDGDADRAESTLTTMDEQTREGAAWLAVRAVDSGDAAPLDRLSTWAAEQSAELGSVRDGVPAPATDELDASLLLLGDITARADGLRAVLSCATGPAPTGTDALGPVPDGCLPEPGAPQQPVPPTVPGGPPSAPTVQAPAPVEPGAPSAPTGQQPAPGAVVPQAPGTPSVPVPTTAPAGGGLPLPLPLPTPSVPAPAPGAPTPAPGTPAPLIEVPLDLGVCLDLPAILRAGRC
jgi:hypothetical protein